ALRSNRRRLDRGGHGGVDVPVRRAGSSCGEHRPESRRRPDRPDLCQRAAREIWANYLDVYTAGLSALALNIRLRRWAAALAVGLLGGILAFFAMFVSNFKDQYTNFLLITYLWVP